MNCWGVTILIAAGITAMAPTASGQRAAIPTEVNTAIRKLSPGATVLSFAGVNSVSCAPVGETPGIVKADFNGDEHEDYAVLLKGSTTGRSTQWEGTTLHEFRFSLVFFLDDGKGGYTPLVAHRYADFIPTITVVDLEPAGTVHDATLSKDVSLRFPAVTLSYCEKSSTIYYLSGGKVRSVAAGD